MKSRSGITLIQLLVGGVLGALVMYFSGSFFFQVNKTLNKSIENKKVEASLQIISGNLQKYMSSGDTLFFGFSGNGGTGDKPLARFLIPQAGKCADLSDNCPEDTMMLYIHYDKTTSPSVSVICALDNQTWLADLSRTTYGTATAVTNGFDVNAPSGFASGRIRASVGETLALLNPPYATIWQVTQAPSPYAVNQSFSAGQPPTLTPALPGDCTANLQRLPAQGSELFRYNVSNLYQIKTAPLKLTQFTGGNTVSAGELQTARGSFPGRFFNAVIRSVGREPGTESKFVIKNCGLSGGNIACNGQTMAFVEKTKQARIEAFYNVKLQGATADSFDLKGTSEPAYSGCDSTCAALTIADNAAIKVFYTAAETASKLDSTGFSLLKQESLSKLRFHVVFEQKKENFDVLF